MAYNRQGSCPHCRREFDGHYNTSGHRAPREGDVTVCSRCGNYAIFVVTGLGDIMLRLPTAKEAADITNDVRGQKIRHALGFES